MNKFDNKGKPEGDKSGDNKNSSGGVVIMTGVAKRNNAVKNKGELIEQNQDGLEVSLLTKFNIKTLFSTITILFKITMYSCKYFIHIYLIYIRGYN